MLVPVKLDLPEEYLGNISDGSYSITEAVIRNNQTGRFVEFTDIIPDNDESVGGTGFVKSNAALLGIGATILVGGLIYLFVRQKNDKSKAQVPECVNRFKEDLKIYLTAAKAGEINEDSIDRLLSDLDEIEATKDTSITIDLSTKEMSALLEHICAYTMKMAEANGYTVKSMDINKDNNLICFKKYLKIQKEIISVA